MDGERIKEAFDDDYRAGASLQHSMEIEEHERFAEAGRKAILRFLVADGAPRVRDQRAVLVVDGNHDSTAQKAAAPIEAHLKCTDRLRGQAAAG